MLAAKICRYGKAWSWVFIGTLLLTMKSASGQSFRPLHAPDHAHQLAHLVLQVSSQPHPLGENLDALSSDIQRALELMQVEGLAHAQSASVPEVKLETIQASLSQAMSWSPPLV